MTEAVVDHSKKVIDDLDSLLSQLHSESAKRRNITPNGAGSFRPQSGTSSTNSDDTTSNHPKNGFDGQALLATAPSHHYKSPSPIHIDINAPQRPSSIRRDLATNPDERRSSTARELDCLLQELNQAKRFSTAKKSLTKSETPSPNNHQELGQEESKNGEILNRTAYLSLSPTQLSNESKANVENLLAELHTVIRASPSIIKNQQINHPNFASYTTSMVQNSGPQPKSGGYKPAEISAAIDDNYERPNYPQKLKNDMHMSQPALPPDDPAEEIDDLYSSISEVKLVHGQIPAHQNNTKERSNLDRMLGQLEKDLKVGPHRDDRSYPYGGENNNFRGDSNPCETVFCAQCKELIMDQSISALGKNWHLEHFVCAECRQELGTKNFFEYEGRPFCEEDYHRLFSPKCAHCSLPILEKCVTALDQTWHPEHFCCAKCERLFAPNEGFHEVEGKPYCREDYFELFAPKCKACTNPIMENFISALQAHWHPDCFVCQDCHMPFGNGSFFEHGGWPCCETHYHSRRGSLCAGCGKPIASGKCVTALYKKFHPEHFVCAFCLKQLSATFKEQNDKPYCHSCFEKLFS